MDSRGILSLHRPQAESVKPLTSLFGIEATNYIKKNLLICIQISNRICGILLGNSTGAKRIMRDMKDVCLAEDYFFSKRPPCVFYDQSVLASMH